MLFETAKRLLSPAGSLLLTTPNPYAPSRVHAGQRGIVWENVDHILYAFPSGIAELAERHGLVLAEAATTIPTKRGFFLNDRSLRAFRQALRGRQWVNVGYATEGKPCVVRVGARLTAYAHQLAAKPGFCGETFVYVVRRTTDTADAR